MFVVNPTADLLTRGIVLGILGMIWVIALVRLLGLRSFSKMTAFDFVRTIAAGSLLAGAAQALDWTGFAQAITGMTTLFLFQYLAALARRRSDIAELILQNEPVFPMKDGKLIEEALRKTRVDVSDVYAKLREANALRLSEVHAVVLETTGDISVLHGGSRPDDEVMTNVC